jgi:hypothetical protein
MSITGTNKGGGKMKDAAMKSGSGKRIAIKMKSVAAKIKKGSIRRIAVILRRVIGSTRSDAWMH